jgi:hypothetical protein
VSQSSDSVCSPATARGALLLVMTSARAAMPCTNSLRLHEPGVGSQHLHVGTAFGSVRICLTEDVPNATEVRAAIVGAGGNPAIRFPRCARRWVPQPYADPLDLWCHLRVISIQIEILTCLRFTYVFESWSA